MKTQTISRETAREILAALEKHYPNAKIILNYSNAWELLVAVMLSAQCTDVMVNRVTKKLFKKYKTIEEYATAPIEKLEQLIRSTGFYHNKAKNIQNSAKIILDKFHGKVPDTMEELISLPGVARKTANVVLANAFHKAEGIAVDTHVRRLSQWYHLTNHNNPNKIEKDLMNLFDKKDWYNLTYLLIEHGRTVDTARNPKQELCFIEPIAPHHKKLQQS